MKSNALLFIALWLVGCGAPQAEDAAHTENPEMQKCLGDNGYRDTPDPSQQKLNFRIELQCRQVIELRRRQH